MKPILWILIGTWIGGTLGFLTAALACAASRADERIEAQHAQPPTQDWEEHA